MKNGNAIVTCMRHPFTSSPSSASLLTFFTFIDNSIALFHVLSMNAINVNRLALEGEDVNGCPVNVYYIHR
jgi:hypothetical protein